MYISVVPSTLCVTAARGCHGSQIHCSGPNRFWIPYFTFFFLSLNKVWWLQEHDDPRNLMLLLLQGT